MVTAEIDYNALSMSVNLFVSGKNLKKMDLISQSDPRCIIFQKFDYGWSKLETTEKIKNTADPNFKKPVSLPYFFEEVQLLRFRFEDGDEGENDFIGEAEVKLGSIMGAKGAFEVDLMRKGKTGRGKLVVRAEAVKESRVHVNFMMEWFGMHTYMGGFCGMCGEEQDLYVEFTKMNEANN